MDQTPRFRDRADAGARLGEALAQKGLADRDNLIVLGLPRGGVAVAAEVARRLQAPLDVLVVRKLGVPGHEELAMGAIASGGSVVRNDEVIDNLAIPDEVFAEVVAREAEELARRERLFRGDRPPLDVRDKVVVVVDDGLATGSTMRAALRALRPLGPQARIVAVPVAAVSSCESLRDECDACACLITPEPFRAVGLWYADFTQTSDDEVRELLRASQPPPHRPSAADDRPLPPATETEVAFQAGSRWVRGFLERPANLQPASGLVVFAHGSGSGRLSPRNQFVAAELRRHGLATLLIDLLEPDEAEDRSKVFDITLLAERVLAAIAGVRASWHGTEPRIGLFGASTGAAAALQAAAARPDWIAAVVSRGGRPDLAWDCLGQVRAPTLLIVGEQDPIVLDLNRHALERLTSAPAKLVVIPGATHLFPEPGALETVARLAAEWFTRWLG
ncbi:MAG: hypothetical protein KatS3mg108_3712 [Isosphaeraceae bacterium]|jgi:putative phosphoribosyl transferase|nr:MAG: hypothetical protein KatS3mg108_3712 [Isosphaeraceae bacterium]